LLELSVLGPKRGFVLVAFLDSDEVIGIPEVLSSISEIGGTGYRFFTVAVLRTPLSTHSRGPSSFFAYEIGAAAGSDELYLSQLLVSLALSEIS
jgi:hypothetical protein